MMALMLSSAEGLSHAKVLARRERCGGKQREDDAVVMLESKSFCLCDMYAQTSDFKQEGVVGPAWSST